MGTVSLKRVVADAIANFIAANVTGLTGKVSAVAAGPETMAPCLAVKVIANRMKFEPTDLNEVYWDEVTDDRTVVLDVGQFTGTVTLELFAVSAAERELYEQRILDLFLKTKWAPGTLFITTPTLTVNGYISLYSAEAKLRLESEEWNEEFSFEAKRYSFLDLFLDFPALTTDIDAPTIESLQVALDSELVDVVEVQLDGTTTKP